MNRFLCWMWLFCGAGLVTDAVAQGPSIADAVTLMRDIDLAACQTYHNGVATAADEGQVLGVLGLLPKQQTKKWFAGKTDRSVELHTFAYRLAFKRPVSLGAIFVDGQVVEVRLLKDDASFPGDPEKPEHWTSLAIPARQGGAKLIPLDAPVTTRSLLFVEQRRNGYGELYSVRLFKQRMSNITPWSLAYADREFIPSLGDFAPFPASSIPAGKSKWENTGKDNKGLIAAPPVSDVAPSWFLLTWNEPRDIAGLWLNSNITKLELAAFDGADDVHPRAATESEWRKIKTPSIQVLTQGMDENTRWIEFPPVKTRGLRLLITGTQEGPVARISGLHTISPLGTAPLPPLPRAATTEPPLTIAVPKLDADRNLTLVINDAEGRRVRSLITRARPEDLVDLKQIGWDLKDDAGNFVPPGKYQWSALSWPDLQVKYEMTVYPNVSQHAPNNAPWLTGTSGSGGWMADHTPPCSGCVAGDKVFLGSYVAESGVSLIECDLDGRKRWGHHSFAAWTGARFLAADAKHLYVGAPILNTNTESVWTVDLESKQVKNLLTLNPTSSRKRGLQGLAAHGGKLYLSVRGQESWLNNAMSADDVDLAACLPLLPPKRKPRAAYEIVWDPQGDFLRLFRLTGTVPGGATQATNPYLDTQTGSGSQQHLVLAFKKPVPIGSVAFPVPPSKDIRVRLSVLKSGAPYPPNADDARQWTPFVASGDQPWDVVAAPANTVTRALRVSFVKASAEDDPLANVLNDPLATKPAKPTTPGSTTKKNDPLSLGDGFDLGGSTNKPKKDLLGFGGDGGTWKGRIEGMKLLRRRFENVSPAATVRTNSGKLAADGSWDAQRTAPLTEAAPAIYALEWKTPQTLRGLALKEIDGAITKIDILAGSDSASSAGSASGPVDISADAGWENVAEYKQQRRDHHSGFESANHLARYVDGYVDFGREVTTRAVRLRVISQWTDHGNRGDEGVRPDQGGKEIEPARCHVYGVAALKYVGGESPVESAALERIETFDAASGQLVQETPLAAPHEIACAPDGRLFALSDKQVVRVNFSGGGSHEPFITDLEKPTDFAFDKAGHCYVFDDAASRRQVRVYDLAGKFVRAIGEPGGFVAGTWNPRRFGHVGSLDIDARGQLWAVETQYHPKRVTVWTTAGEFQKELLGNTPYGGGGVLDPWDKTRLFHGPLEFELNWQTGQSRLKNMTWLGRTAPGDVPVMIDGRRYLVTRPEFQEQRCGVVYRYENGVATLAAAVGQADSFEPLKDAAVLTKLGNIALTDHRFRWSDANEDGAVQAGEVTLVAGSNNRHGVTNFNRDLGIQFGPVRYFVQSFSPRGVPIYDEEKLPGLDGRDLYRLHNGDFYRFSVDRGPDGVWTAAGKPRWLHEHEGWGVQALQTAKPWSPGQVVSQFGVVGNEKDVGELGEIVVVHSNHGAWNIWTADGLLVGPIFRDLRDPRARPWSMPEHSLGQSMPDLTISQEHFRGYFCRAADGKYYVVAGHNHISVLEVQGLEKFRRLSGDVAVGSEDLAKARAWDEQREKTELLVRSPVLDCYRLRKPPEFDGKLTGFGPPAAEMSSVERTNPASFFCGYDDSFLYVAYKTRGQGPLKNGGDQWERIFKSGAAVDLWLATDPDADPRRQAPVAGDVRVLLTFVKNKPLAVLYRAVVAGTPSDKAFRVTSPVGETVIDQVKQLSGLKMIRSGDNGYTVEAAIPLAELGLRPSPNLRLKMDWGLIVSGAEGTEVLRRIYWANQATQIIADAPSEARFQPHLWGHARFHSFRPSPDERLAETDPTTASPASKETKKDLGDILDDLKSKK